MDRTQVILVVVLLLLAASVGVSRYVSRTREKVLAERIAALDGRVRELDAKLQNISSDVGALQKRTTSLDVAALQKRITSSTDTSNQFLRRLVAVEAELETRKRERETVEAAPTRPSRPAEALRDTFEEGITGWMVPVFLPMMVGEIAHVTGEGIAKEGRGAMKLSYSLAEGKIAIAVRSGDDVTGVDRISLWVKSTDAAALIWVGATETDMSSYGVVFQLTAGEGWRKFDVRMLEMELAEGSRDENGRLDVDQIMSLSIADVGSFAGRTGENSLVIDEFRATRSPARKPGHEEAF